MCTSMHAPCKSLRGSVVEGSLVSFLWWEKEMFSKNHRGALALQEARSLSPILTLPRAVYIYPSPFQDTPLFSAHQTQGSYAD